MSSDLILLFPKSYPYDSAAEHTFLGNEISHLKDTFDRVILVPRTTEGTLLPVPSSVEIDTGLADFFKEHGGIVSILFKGLGSPSFHQELRAKSFLLFQPFKLAKLILFSGRATLVMLWVDRWMKNSPDLSHKTVLYTYWFDETATGLSLSKQKYPQLKLISRAHGYDIYEEQYFPYYWPFRQKTLPLLNKLFAASDDGREYLRKRFPEFYNLFETAHLGVKDPGFISKWSPDGMLRIVSCSHIWPLKRLDLLSQGIAVAARMRPGQKFIWCHFGGGKGRKTLQKEVTEHFPPNATGTFPGFLPNQEIMQHYREQPVDVFVNLSTTEGGAPVAIQEAISCGIPVIATKVGGNPEIVSDRNGLLLSPDPTAEEVANALLAFCDNPEMAQRMRTESRKVWQESYNADVNFRAFAEKLKLIAES